jgi:hypothetical protein
MMYRIKFKVIPNYIKWTHKWQILYSQYPVIGLVPCYLSQCPFTIFFIYENLFLIFLESRTMSFFIRKGGGSGAKNSLAAKKRKATSQPRAKKGKKRQVGWCSCRNTLYMLPSWEAGGYWRRCRVFRPISIVLHRSLCGGNDPPLKQCSLLHFGRMQTCLRLCNLFFYCMHFN